MDIGSKMENLYKADMKIKSVGIKRVLEVT